MDTKTVRGEVEATLAKHVAPLLSFFIGAAAVVIGCTLLVWIAFRAWSFLEMPMVFGCAP